MRKFVGMSLIDDSLAPLRKFHAEIGTRKLAQLTGVPYTSVRDFAERGFGGPTIDVLKRIEAAAMRHAAGQPPLSDEDLSAMAPRRRRRSASAAA